MDWVRKVWVSVKGQMATLATMTAAVASAAAYASSVFVVVASVEETVVWNIEKTADTGSPPGTA